MHTIIDKGGKIMIKKYIILIFSLVSLTPIFSQDYYWYGSQKVFLIPQERRYVLLDNTEQDNYSTVIQLRKIGINKPQRDTVYYGILNKHDFEALNQSKILYSAPTYKQTIDSKEVFVSHFFYVKLKNSSDFNLLNEFALQNKVTIEYHSDYLPLWYVLSCINSHKNALEMANLFYESGLFEVAEPDFWQADETLSATDPLFAQQWNLQNTGQHNSNFRGIDINYNGVSTLIPQQSDIVVAVLDQGIQLDHPDLGENILDEGYDTDSHSSPSVVSGNHGTSCAGIIGAISNNGIGISGIFNGKLMSISNTLGGSYLTRFNRAEGIIYAADNGVDVISNSWGCSINISAIDEAIDYAIENGRNGLGCIIVFSSGNDDIKYVNYPANCDERIIVVGAASPCGERKSEISCDGEDFWGSQFGPELDVMAPGVFIPTTDRTGTDGYTSSDYVSDFWGTSAACPHVAAVAGLVLSVNPTLTAKQVTDIIESTAQKVGEYDYDQTEGRPNGTWHEEMGYGLVDAYEAVLAAQPKYIQNLVYQSGKEVYEYATEITAGYAVTDNKPYGNVILEAGSDVTLRAMEQVVLKPGFHAKAGSKLHIKVDSPTTTQFASSPQQLAPRTSSAPTDDKDATMEEVINTVESVSVFAPSVQKIIKEGQLLILRVVNIYNIMGVEVGE